MTKVWYFLIKLRLDHFARILWNEFSQLNEYKETYCYGYLSEGCSMMKYEIQLQITEFSAMTILLRAVQNNMTSQYIRLPIKAI